MASPDSKSFTQLKGHLTMIFGSQGKCTKAIHTTSTTVGSEDISGVTTDDQQHLLSHNSCRHQNKTNAQATELNCALDENHKLKEMFNPDWLVEAMTKAVSNMTMKESPKTSQGPQYKGNSNYVGRPRQPKLAHGADGRLKPNVSCHYCKDKGHSKDNCVCLNNKIA